MVATPIEARQPGRTNLARSVEGRRQWTLAALSIPALMLLVGLFAYPVFRLMLLSFEGWTLEHYQRALFDTLYLRVLWDTLRISAIVTVASLLLSYPVAYLLATTTRFWAVVGFTFVMLPFWTSILVRTYAWMVVLGRNGVLNGTLMELGLIERPLALLHNELGVLIGMVHVLMPFMLLPIYSAMRRVDQNLVQAAQGLGAPGWRVLTRVYLPLTSDGILAGSVLVFVLSIGFFITPALLGGGRVMMISMLIEQQVREFLNWSFASALAAVLLAATLLVYAGVQRLSGGRSAIRS
jgi:ABC-type spermidine/putrescine transport system permease subunit I